MLKGTRNLRKDRRGGGLFSALTGVAIVSALGCAWTLGNQLASGHRVATLADLRMSDARATFAERAEFATAATFAERFGETTTASRSEAETNFAAMFDPSASLGPATGTFRKRPPAVLSGWSATSTQTAEAALPRAAPQPARQQVASLNLPAVPRASLSQPAELSGSPHERLVQRATSKLLASAAAGKASIFEKLLGKLQPAGPVLAYAGPDSGMPGLSPSLAASTSAMDRVTAVYDITKRVVYMPDGSKLEAHSGLGNRMDDPDYAHERMRGVTPPHIYDLKPREALFHGVPALRMIPIGGEGAIHGRNGILAHTYMLGPNGQSNGCISFKDYYAFLRAYRSGEIKRIVVIGKLD